MGLCSCIVLLCIYSTIISRYYFKQEWEKITDLQRAIPKSLCVPYLFQKELKLSATLRQAQGTLENLSLAV